LAVIPLPGTAVGAAPRVLDFVDGGNDECATPAALAGTTALIAFLPVSVSNPQTAVLPRQVGGAQKRQSQSADLDWLIWPASRIWL
jgi:hypothetical protein